MLFPLEVTPNCTEGQINSFVLKVLSDLISRVIMRDEIGLHLGVNHIWSFKTPVWLNLWPANCLLLDSVPHANMNDNSNKVKYLLFVHDSLQFLTNGIICILTADAASELFRIEAPPIGHICNNSCLTCR